jgi:glutathione peroxidase-family protein
MKYHILFTSCIVLSSLSNAQETKELRLWTSEAGTTLQAKMKSATADSVILEKPNGKTVTVSLKSLSELDQKYITSDGVEVDPFAETKEPPAVAAVAPKLPESFPKDPLLETIPWLKRLSEAPLEFQFTDFKTDKKMTQDDFKGKYIYLHTEIVTPDSGNRLKELKLLLDKYGNQGFVIISFFKNPNAFRYAENEDFKNKRAIKAYFENLIKDYGANWPISYCEDTEDPVIKKLSREKDFQWLVNPEGNIICSQICSYRTQDVSNLPLKEALEKIFGR